MKKSRKRLTAAMAILCCLSLLVGSFAFFTDRLTANTGATAGNMDLVWEDTSLATGSNNEFAIDQVWDNKSLVEDGVINPGDYFDLSYTLTNAGSKSMDVRQQLILTSDVPMTDAAEEYQLTIITVAGETAIKAKEVSATAEGGTQIVYDLNDITINGELETEDGAFTFADGAAYTVRLDFAKNAGNAFMGSNVAVSYKAQAKQHRNTNDSHWATWAEYETKYGEIDANGGAAGGEEVDPNAVAFAVYSEDDTSLRFYKRAEVPVAGQEYNGLTATAVYMDIEALYDLPGWYYDENCYSVTNVVVEDKIQPLFTNYWFSDFYNCTSMNLAKLDTSRVLNAEGMFYNCSGLTELDISHFDTSNVVLMNSMFENCCLLTELDVSSFDTSNVENMEDMFNVCSGLTELDLSNFDTSKVTNMKHMFLGCGSLETIYASDLWSTASVVSSEGMFSNCPNLVGDIAQGGSTFVGDIDATYATTTGGYLTYKPAA